jgi:hypothetical protein
MKNRHECSLRGDYWKAMILILVSVIVNPTTIVHRSVQPSIRWVSSHSDCGTIDLIESDTSKDDAEEIRMFGRPIR